MNDKTIADICTILSTMKADQKWTDSHDEAFLIGLEDLPDEAGPLLRREILKQWTWRPSVKDIRDLWVSISGPPALSPADIVGALSGYVQKYGAYAQPHPTLKNVRVLGPPPEMTPQETAVVVCWGGWENYANDDSPVGVKRGQALKIAEMVVKGGGDEDVRRLRLEYQEQRAALPAPESEAMPPFGDLRNGSSGGMTRLGALGIKDLK